MMRAFFATLMLFITTATWANLARAVEASQRFDRYSVLPFAELQPGFTTVPRQRFTLNLGGIGREPIRILTIAINDRVLRKSAWNTQLGQLTIVPDQDLDLGLNRIVIRYDHSTDRAHRSAANPVVYTFLVNHQLSRSEIKFGLRGELVVDGESRFIRGGYRSGQVDGFVNALPSAAEAGFNMVHDYRFETYDVKQHGVEPFIREARSYLRRAKELGLGVFLGLPRTVVRNHNETVLATIVSALSNESALWLWYIYDEPDIEIVDIETAAQTYSLLRRLDPTRPSVILTNHIRTMVQYHPFCDALWYDRYPIIATSEELSSLAPIAAAIQKSLEAVGPHKPVWPVLQVHDNKGSPALRKHILHRSKPTDSSHRPDERQIRAQTHLALAQGVMSVMYYWAPESWYSMKTDTPGIWRSLSLVLKELRSLEPVLLSSEEPPVMDVSGGHDKIMMWTRRHQGSVYVGLVNASLHTPAALTVKSPSKKTRARKVLGDGRVVESSAGARVHLESAGVVVLEFDMS